MATITMRVEDKLKADLQELLADLGMDMTTFFTVCSKKALREQGIPFEVSREVPNAETLEAFAEAERMKEHPEQYKSYTDVDALMEDLLA